MPEPTAFLLFAASVGIAKATHDAAVPNLKPFNGQHYTREGGKLMDKTIDILSDQKRSACMVPSVREGLLLDHQRLQPTRLDLEQATNSMLGSITKSGKARKFHSNAKEVHDKTRMASDSTLVEAELKSGKIQGIDMKKHDRPPGASRAEVQTQQQALSDCQGNQSQTRGKPGSGLNAKKGSEVQASVVEVEMHNVPRSSTSSAERNLRVLLGGDGKK